MPHPKVRDAHVRTSVAEEEHIARWTSRGRYCGGSLPKTHCPRRIARWKCFSALIRKTGAAQEQLAEIADKHSVESGVVAVAYRLHDPAVTPAIVAARRSDQIDGTIAAASFALSDDEYRQLRIFAETRLA